MATDQQTAANRRNARKSTGPRTQEGKHAARFNALKSGIYAESEVVTACEDPDQLKALTIEYYDTYQPANIVERCLVDSLVSSEWLLRRFRAIDGQYMSREIREAWSADVQTPLGQGWDYSSKELDRLQRRLNATYRRYERTLRTLQELQANRPAEIGRASCRERV